MVNPFLQNEDVILEYVFDKCVALPGIQPHSQFIKKDVLQKKNMLVFDRNIKEFIKYFHNYVLVQSVYSLFHLLSSFWF